MVIKKKTKPCTSIKTELVYKIELTRSGRRSQITRDPTHWRQRNFRTADLMKRWRRQLSLSNKVMPQAWLVTLTKTQLRSIDLHRAEALHSDSSSWTELALRAKQERRRVYYIDTIAPFSHLYWEQCSRCAQRIHWQFFLSSWTICDEDQKWGHLYSPRVDTADGLFPDKMFSAILHGAFVWIPEWRMSRTSLLW